MASIPRKEHSEEAESAISVLRALVLSKKGPSTVQSILADYRELEGGPLMYKKFGYPNADEFLKSTGEFVVQSRMGETVIFVKPSADSVHILKMVAAQKTTKTRKSGFSILRQPQKRTGGNNWNPSAYNKMYSQMPNKSSQFIQKKYSQQSQNNYQRYQNNPLKPFFQNTPSNVGWTNNNRYTNGNQSKPLMAVNKVAPTSTANSKIYGNNTSQNVNNQRYNRIETNNNNSTVKNFNKASQDSAKTAQVTLNSNDLRHILNERAPQMQQRQSSQLELKNQEPQFVIRSPEHRNEQNMFAPSKAIDKDNHQMTHADTGNKQPHLPPTSSGTPAQDHRSVNSRLQVTKDVVPTSPPVQKMPKSYPVRDVPPSFDDPIIVPTPVAPLRTIPGQKTLQDRLKSKQQVDSSDLEKAARVVAANKPSNVEPKVNGSTYSTYPDDFSNEFEGQFAAAQIAIANIKRDEEINNYSVCLDSDYEIAIKIHELLLQCPHGMFSKNIPEAFRRAHQLLLPDHWELIIMSQYSHMFSKDEVQENTIVFANAYEETGSSNSSPSITSEAKCMTANVLQLPWNEQYWNLYITNPVSTVEIWARLVGPEFSDKMDSLITDIELSMMGNDKRKPSSVTIGEYYLVQTPDCWYRVRIDEIDCNNNQSVCFFIDVGEWERVALDDIYVCDAKYLHLPGQSLCFSLDGLEDFGENPKAKPHLDNLISGKVCIGEILTPRNEYEKDRELISVGDVRIKMILYDTSSDEDVNLNPVILKHICDDTPMPELNKKGVTTVVVTHVDDSGDVYCQLKDDAMVYIQKLINNLVKSNALEGKHRGLYASKGKQQLYLVNDEKDNKWYRASLEAEQSGPFCRMLYVDRGIQKLVNVQNIYQLEMLSVALSRYPAQAIRMRMFDIPEITDYLLSRMRVLLKTGLTAMVKVAALSVIPLVKIYVHLEQTNILVCINDSIRSEMELEINSEMISNPRIASNELSSTSSIASSVKLNTSIASDYSIGSHEAAELSRSFSGLNIEQRKLSSPVPSQVTPKLPKYPLPAIGELFDVCVTIASSPNYFIVQPYSHAVQLHRMMVELQEYCKTKAERVPVDSIQQGEVYAGINSDDRHWYRVIAVNILSGSIHVYFCDFGQIRVVDSDSLRILPAHLRSIPQQAVKARLHGVQPIHGDWSTEDAVRFQQLTVDKKFASYIYNIKSDEFSPNEEIVDLMLIDVSTDEDILIHKILVDEKRAVLTSK
ncbi:tudor domain-containing protein 7A isoform X2 [Aedes albopictus]|uniref:Tudor domain-containing protein 7 n=1 Tax=Aedes albopictus TaxID=7160 RepID=A0ABM1XRZ6_AEDAL|nr:tudor domain-containing protein 7A-like isoform X2 [Aedes albopictus]